MGRRTTILSSLAIMAVSSCGSPPAANTPPVQVPVTQQTPLPSAQPNRPAGTQTVELDILAEGSKSQLKQPGFQAIRSTSELDSFIRQAGLQDVDHDIDWKDQMVLAVFAGERSGTLDITSLQLKDGELIAKVDFEPASGAAASTATGAFMLVVVPKEVAEIDVRGLPEVCSSGPPAASASPAPSPAPTVSPSASPVPPSPTSGQGAVQILAQGAASGVRQPVNVIVRTNEEWQAVWTTHAQGIPAQAQPTIDLNQQSIIGIFLGEQQGIGGIALDGIQQTQTGTIQITAHVVAGAAAQGQAKASPFMFIAVPKLPAIPVEIQVQGGPQASTLGNPQQQQQSQPTTGFSRPGFGQPVAGGPQPGFGQPVGGSQLGGMPGGPSLGQGAGAAPAFPIRGSMLTGGGGGMFGPNGYVPR